ncbi:TonB-dependent receptor [Tenacibaculum halocynthiae]|uniref:hypothetical protein n=1 Tax=Tenacibaculum halocynthiae TaxID=1254437 RepID=UPI00261D8191|nr:hypothetical protein [uncultured Tenacibaculum sp.]
MKKHVWLLVLFTISIVNAQDKNTKKAKDTIIKTEVVKVITSYVPKITDAFKIKEKPTITHTKETEKKKLDYQIFSVPVASTFIPKSGALKKISLGKRERLYDNYISAGFGNIVSPFIETYIRKSMNRDSESGVYAKLLLSLDPVENTKLSSTYYNLDIDLYHQQVQRYFVWEAGLNLERNKYNWYGLPTNIDFTNGTIDAIEEAQTYGYYNLYGKINFDDSYIDTANGSVSFFSDAFSSSEFNIDAAVNFNFPLEGIHRNLNDLLLKTSVNFLGGKFANAYESQNEIKYSFLTLGVNPYYKFNIKDLSIKLGGKGYFSMDIEKTVNHFLLYPDVEISYPIVKDFANIFIGATGGLKNNTYKNYSDNNPYVSPTLDVTQTNEKYNAFGGIKGKMSQQFSYNFKASYSDIEDRPFYTLNYSKSDGKKSTGSNGFILNGYEFGNSFRVIYNDTKLISFFGEVAFEGIKNLTVGANLEFNKFTLENQLHPWNEPKIKGELFGSYKVDKWYAGANLFFVGERKGVQYDGITPSPFTTVNLKSYIDINFNGGYHFHDDFSVFLNLKNVLNNNYQQYTNFGVQGFQALGGITWKFDSLF